MLPAVGCLHAENDLKLHFVPFYGFLPLPRYGSRNTPCFLNHKMAIWPLYGSVVHLEFTCLVVIFNQGLADELVAVNGNDEFTVYIASVGKVSCAK